MTWMQNVKYVGESWGLQLDIKCPGQKTSVKGEVMKKFNKRG